MSAPSLQSQVISIALSTLDTVWEGINCTCNSALGLRVLDLLCCTAYPSKFVHKSLLTSSFEQQMNNLTIDLSTMQVKVQGCTKQSLSSGRAQGHPYTPCPKGSPQPPCPTGQGLLGLFRAICSSGKGRRQLACHPLTQPALRRPPVAMPDLPCDHQVNTDIYTVDFWLLLLIELVIMTSNSRDFSLFLCTITSQGQGAGESLGTSVC